MIVEKFPELADLDAEQKLILAGELWRSATSSGESTPELTPEAVKLLEDRLSHLEADLNTGTRWDDLRDRKFSK